MNTFLGTFQGKWHPALDAAIYIMKYGDIELFEQKSKLPNIL